MYEKMKDLMDDCEKLMESSMAQVGFISAVGGMGDDELKAVRDFANIYKKSKNLLVEMAKMMDEQNEKLDEILALLKKKN
jgi:hypothetical protein